MERRGRKKTREGEGRKGREERVGEEGGGEKRERVRGGGQGRGRRKSPTKITEPDEEKQNQDEHTNSVCIHTYIYRALQI